MILPYRTDVESLIERPIEMCKGRPTRLCSGADFSADQVQKCLTVYSIIGQTNEMRLSKRSLPGLKSLSGSKFQARDLWYDNDKVPAYSFLLTKTSIAFHHLHWIECRWVILKRRHIWKLVESYLSYYCMYRPPGRKGTKRREGATEVFWVGYLKERTWGNLKY